MDAATRERLLEKVIVPIEISARTEERIGLFIGLTVADIRSKFVSIKGAHLTLGYGYEEYTRALLLQGKIEGVKIQLKGYRKWFISKESIGYYLEHSARKGKPSRYILRIDKSTEGQVREALDSLNISYELEIAYRGKKDKKDNGG